MIHKTITLVTISPRYDLSSFWVGNASFAKLSSMFLFEWNHPSDKVMFVNQRLAGLERCQERGQHLTNYCNILVP
jgi:hypothetical protein